MIRAYRPGRATVATRIGILLLEGALALAGGVMLVVAHRVASCECRPSGSR